MKKHATALRAFTHADDAFADRQVILGMDAGQFADWQGAGLVRESTDAEVAKAKGVTAPTAERKPKVAPKRKPRTAKAKATAPIPAVDETA